MDAASMDSIVEQLWEIDGEGVFALLDGARDARIRPMILASGLPHACLYAGPIAPALAAVAPYVVRLEQGGAFTHRLLREGWGRSWGVFGGSAANLEAVRRHWRRFLRVRTEAGQTLLFRFYDPRVLRVYVPTCTEGELGTFFGPFSRLVVEDEDPAHLWRYGRQTKGEGKDDGKGGQAFERSQRRVAPPPGPEALVFTAGG